MRSPMPLPLDLASSPTQLRSGPRAARRRPLTGATAAAVLAVVCMIGSEGCDRGTAETQAPERGDEASPKTASLALPLASGKTVLFTVRGNVAAPMLCFDGSVARPGEDEEVCATAMAAATSAAMSSGAVAELGPQEPSACGSSETTFMVYPLRAAANDNSKLAITPASQAGSMRVVADWIEPTAAEKEALAALVMADADRQPGAPLKLDWFSGLAADLDADGKLDRVFGAHDESALLGVVAVFLGKDPTRPVSLSLLAFDFPRVVAVTNVDGKAGDEVVIEAAFVEGIENETVTSAFSTRVVALENGAAVEVGSWGCRMF